MSWQASAWAKKCRPRSPTHRLVMLVAADFAAVKAAAIGLTVPEGWAVCWAGIDEIADDCGLSGRTVKRVLAELATDGFIRRDHRNAPNSRYGDPGQPKTIRTTDAIWFNYAQPFLSSPPNEAKHAAKVRAGRLGGKVSAARRSAERDAARDARDVSVAALFGSLGEPPPGPPEPVPQVTACLALGDNVLAPQVTPSFTAKPTEEPPVNRQNLACVSRVQTARARPEEDHPKLAEPDGEPTQEPPNPVPVPAPRPAHTRPLGRRPRRAWIDDGTPEPARYRRDPGDTERSRE